MLDICKKKRPSYALYIYISRIWDSRLGSADVLSKRARNGSNDLCAWANSHYTLSCAIGYIVRLKLQTQHTIPFSPYIVYRVNLKLMQFLQFAIFLPHPQSHCFKFNDNTKLYFIFEHTQNQRWMSPEWESVSLKKIIYIERKKQKTIITIILNVCIRGWSI